MLARNSRSGPADHPHRFAATDTDLGRVGQVGDVAGHRSLPVSVCEGLAQDAVDNPHRLRREPAAGAVQLPAGEQVGVELVSRSSGSSLCSGMRARHDVQLDVLLVRAERRRLQLRPLASSYRSMR
jgi:hypothetical protein